MTLACLSFAGYDLTLNVTAALLTIIGYSVNDTIVIFDRVRENAKAMRGDSLAAVVNLSVNQTLSRTVITAGATLLSVLSLYLFGGEALRGFAFTMLVGIVSGTYSTVFIASAIATRLSHTARVPGRHVQKDVSRHVGRSFWTGQVFLEQALVVDVALAHELSDKFQFGTERERSRRNHPRRFPDVRVFDSDVVLQGPILEPSEALDDVQRLGVHEAVDFRLVVEADRVDDQRVSVPAADRSFPSTRDRDPRPAGGRRSERTGSRSGTRR